jgi:hypothetical protein
MEFHVKYIEVTVSYSKYRAQVQTWLFLCGRCKTDTSDRRKVIRTRSGMTLNGSADGCFSLSFPRKRESWNEPVITIVQSIQDRYVGPPRFRAVRRIGDDIKSTARWSLLFVFGIEGGGAWET